MTDLTGRVAIVTGGGRGIGAATSRLFAQFGAKAVIGDIDGAAAQACATEVGSSALAVELDVTDPDSWRNCVESAESAFGPVTILINNAGVYFPGDLNETTVAQVEHMFRVNQLGPLLGIRAVTPGMAAAGGGSIVNIASTGGVRPAPFSIAYSTTKWAVRGLSQSAAAALAPMGIRVNTVVPGLIDTRMAQENDPETISALVARTAASRMGEALEVAHACLYLCSDRARYVVGTELSVDGGLLLT